MGLLDIMDDLNEKIKAEAEERVDEAVPEQPEKHDEASEHEEVGKEDEEIVDAPENEETEEDEDEIPKEQIAWAKKRRELRQLKQEKQELAERLAKLEGRFEQSQEMAPKPSQPPQHEDPMPDATYDKEAFLEWQLRQQAKAVNNMAEQLNTLNFNNRISKAKEEFRGYEDEFERERKDYKEAKSYLRSSLEKELAILQPKLSPAQIRSEVDMRELQIAGNAAAAGLHPAKALAQLAESRGYSLQKSSGTKSPSINLDKIKQNSAKSTNMIGMPSKGGKTALTVKDLDQMSTGEKAKYLHDNWEATFIN